MMDDGDRKLFAESVRHATEHHTGTALDAALADLGWDDALLEDRRDAVSILFESQGAANATSSALNTVLATGLGVDPATTTVVLPRLGRWLPPGELVGEDLADDALLVRGLATSGLRTCEHAAIVSVSSLTVVATADLDLRPVAGIDPALGLVEVVAQLPSRPAGPAYPAQWSAALAAGQVAIAHELVGCSRTMLQLARDHAVQRVQFGRPISTFQAVRHRLAESLVAIEGAEAAANAAWDDPSPLSAALAKAIAGAGARTVGRHAQQVLGGMGFTTDHVLHRYVRRTLVLDQLLGAGRALMREIGEQLLRTRELPAILPL